jgi:hypothetical protein
VPLPIAALKSQLSEVIATAIIRLIKGEIVAPLSSMAGVWGGNTLYDGLQQAQQEVIAHFEQDQQVRYLNGQAVPAETKPAATIDPRIEHLFEFTADNEEQVAHYAEEVLHHQGGLLDVEILSKVGKMNLHLSIDDVYEGSAYGGVNDEAPEIHLNYDSADNKWKSYDSENKQVKIADSVYKILASYTDTAPNTLRETVKYYIHTNPTEVAALLNFYDEMAALHEAEVVPSTSSSLKTKESVSKPATKPSSVPSTYPAENKAKQAGNTEQILISEDKAPTLYFSAKQLFDNIQHCGGNAVCRIQTAGSAYSILLQSQQAMQACQTRVCLDSITKLYEQLDTLTESLSGYSVEAAAISAVKDAYARPRLCQESTKTAS